MLLLQMFFLAAIIAFIVIVTIGEDLEHFWTRIWDLFHPTDRALRKAYERSRRADYLP